MADYRHLLEELYKALNRWDAHAATCKQCTRWYQNKNNGPPSKEAPCNVGMPIVSNILHLLS